MRKIADSAFRATVVVASCGVAACGTTSGGSGLLDQGLHVVGLQRAAPQVPAWDGAGVALPGNVGASIRKITLRLHAGDLLNSDAHGRSLSVVARIYQLRDRVAFEAAPQADFLASRSSRAPDFTADIVAVKEVVLTPGKQYDAIERVGGDAPYFAVVALFRTPAPQRWRFVFDARAAASSGVTLGVHACAMSVSAGQALATAPEMLSVAQVVCPTAAP